MTFSRSSKIAFVVLIIAGVIGFFVWQSHQRAQIQAESSQMLGTVKRQDLIQRVTISGQVWPKKRLDLKPPFNGYIVKLFVKVGERLKTGDPIVTFSPSLSSGEQNFPVRAGFDGIVTQVLRSEGEFVGEAAVDNLVVRFEDVSQLFVLATVPELDIAKIKIGQQALARVSALPNETFKAFISEISLSARDKERYSSSSTEFQIKANIEGHDSRLAPGMTALMDVITNKRENVLTLGHEYIQEKNGESFVITETGANKPVKLGLQTDEAVEILSGVGDGERVRPIDFLSLPKLED